MLRRVIALWLAFVLPVTPALAADWTVTKLRGDALVEIYEVWSPLQRGDMVADDQLVRSLFDSHLELTRGNDVISLGPFTQLQIDDSAANGHTIVRQEFGTVEVSAEILPNEHLEVQTKFLAAVVKGTRFIVTTDDLGASVEVSRGLVAVTSAVTGQTTSLPAGNSAHVTAALGTIALGGIAPLPIVYEPKSIDLPNGSNSSLAPGLRPTESNATKAASVAPVAGVGLPLPATGTSETSAPPTNSMDMATAALGIAIGIMMGAVALLLRRLFA